MDRKWLRHYEPGVPRNLEYPLFPAYMILKNSAILSGERCALREYKTKYKYTFEELFKDSKKMANLPIKMGVKKGDRILLRVPNSNLFVAAFWGIIMSGGVVVALNTAYTEREVANIAEQVKPTYMITHDNFGEDVYETIKMDLKRYREVIKSFPITEPDVGINPEEDLAFIQYTGGTTGEPKGCAFTHENYVAAIYSKTAWTINISKYIDISERQMLCSLPLSHIFGLITLGQSALSLTTVVIMERFGLDEIMRAFVMDKFSTWPCVPTMLSLVLNHKFVKEKNMQITKRIKTITVGGSCNRHIQVLINLHIEFLN